MRDGGILVAGWSGAPGGPQMAVARFLSDGSLDPAFGTDGIASIRVDPSGGSEAANAVGVLPDDRIVVAGAAGRFFSGPTTMSFGAARFMPDGTPDPSFGGDGAVTVLSMPSGNGPIGRVEANALAFVGDRVVLAGTQTPPALTRCDRFSLIELRPDGEPEPSFAGGVGVNIDPPSCAAASDLLITGGQRLLVTGAYGGLSTPRESGAAVVAGLSLDGSLDSAFGSGGFFQKRLFRSASGTYALTADATGSIFATGYVMSDDCWRGHGHKTFTCRAFALMRLKANGQLKKDFGHRGLVTSPLLCKSTFPPCGKTR